ncbi:MAG: tetratricopeptide repeat protein [Nitrospirota bacterium]
MFYLKISVFCVVIVFCFIFIEHVDISSAQSPHVLQGINDFQGGRYEKALQSFVEAYKQEPKNPLTSYYLGMIHKNMQNFKEAVRYLKIALDLDPKLTDLYYEIGDSLFQLGELKEADRYLSEAERFNVRPANTTMMRGLVFMRLGKTKEAIKYLNKAKELEKSIAQMVDYQIANLYMKDNDTTKAKEYFKAVVMADPKSDLAEIAKRYIDDTGLEPKEKKVSITEGRSLRYTDNVLKKTAVMSVAERVNLSVNFFEKGLAEFKAENYEEALVFFEKAYKERPMDPRITFYLGLTHKEMQNYPEAVRFFKETLSLDPKAVDVKFFLADTLFSILKYEEALSIIETAIKEGVRPAESNYLKGLILLKLNKNMEAVEAFKKAKELDTSLTQQADFQIATAYTLEKEFKKAKKMFKGLITIDPTSDWALFSKDYLEALEKIPPPYRLILGIGLQYDDNVLVNPLDEALVDITKQEDLKRIYSLFGEYTLYSKGRWNIKTSYSLGINQHKDRDYPKKTAGEKIFS